MLECTTDPRTRRFIQAAHCERSKAVQAAFAWIWHLPARALTGLVAAAAKKGPGFATRPPVKA